MAGIFGDAINSRADFFHLLQIAQAHVVSTLQKRPNDPTLNSVKQQLDAIQTWTANGRHPLKEERERIRMGYQMYREFEFEADPEIQMLHYEASCLQNYLEYWPDDTTAADPTNDYLLRQ